MGAAQPRKGKGYEREIVNRFRATGIDAERAYGSDGRALGEVKECDVRISLGARRILFQLFRPGRLARKFVPTTDISGVIYRQDRGEDLIMLRLDDYIDLLIASNV